MYQHYYVNCNATHNPGFHHEVHTEDHANQLRITDKKYLGYYASAVDAVAKAKEYYGDADGCAICCPEVHRG